MRSPNLLELPKPPRGKKGWPWTEETPQLPETMPDGQPWPSISIVTPSYNQGRFIEETIRSVLLQGYPNLEYIIMDGGSTDGTLDILKKYSNSLIWISEPDKGQSDAINKGWRISKGEILAYLNSDDTYMPWAAETAAKFLVENPDVGMVYGRCDIINEYSEVIGEVKTDEFDLGQIMCGPNIVPQPSVFIRRTVLDTVGYVDTDLDMAMDFDLWIRIALKFKVQYTPKLLASYRQYPDTKTMSRTFAFWPEYSAIFDKTFRKPDLPKEIKSLERKAYSYVHMMLLLHYRSQHRLRQAFYHLIRTLILYPCRLKELGGLRFLVAFLIECVFGRRVVIKASSWSSRLRVRF
jgi:glycosyltransferase involved in cell wall biosynthesis